MKKLATAAVAFLATSGAALASNCSGPIANQQACQVPEISALEGTAAIAVVAALVLLVWERRRRAS